MSEKSQLQDPRGRWFKDLTFFPRGQALGLAYLLPHFSWFPPSQQYPSSSLGLVVFSCWRVGTSEALLPPPLWDFCTGQRATPHWPHSAALCMCVWVHGCRGLGGLSLQGTQHADPGIYSGAWMQWTQGRSTKVCTQIAWLCIRALHRQAVWSQTSLLPSLNLNFLICKVGTSASTQSCFWKHLITSFGTNLLNECQSVQAHLLNINSANFYCRGCYGSWHILNTLNFSRDFYV